MATAITIDTTTTTIITTITTATTSTEVGAAERPGHGCSRAYGGEVSPVPTETCPLPEHPVLAEFAEALNQAGLWAYVLDREYRVVYMTDELRRSNGGLT